MSAQVVDARGLLCPEPMLMVKRAIEAAGTGTIKALADNAAARENIKRLGLSMGWSVEVTEENGDYVIILKK